MLKRCVKNKNKQNGKPTNVASFVYAGISSFLILAVCLTLFTTSFVDNNEYISRYLENTSTHVELGFSYGDVTYEEDWNWYDFFYRVDDRGGVALKKVTESFFKIDDERFKTNLTLNMDDNIVDSHLLLYTQWNLVDYDYGFNLIVGDKKDRLEPNEVYISSTTAKRLLEYKEDANSNFEDLIGKNITLNFNSIDYNYSNEKVITVVGIIDSNSPSNILKYELVSEDNDFIFMPYYENRNFFRNLKYCFLMYESFLSIDYLLGRINSYISNNENYNVTIYDYDFSKNIFLEGNSNSVYDNTLAYEGLSIWASILMIILLIGLLAVHFFILLPRYIRVNDTVTRRIAFFIISCAAPSILCLLLFLFLPCVLINGISICIVNSNLIIAYLLIFIISIVMLRVLQIVKKDSKYYIEEIRL